MARERNSIYKDKKRGTAMKHLHLIPIGTASSPRERGFGECPCTKNCTLHGECYLCIAYHARKGQLPRCER